MNGTSTSCPFPSFTFTENVNVCGYEGAEGTPLITAVKIQQQVGGSLAGLVDMVADTVRQRLQFARKIKGLTAMGRAGAYVLVALPFFIGAIITIINPTYMDPLYHTHTGHMLIYSGLAMMAFGSLILKKIVSFKG